MNPYAEHAYDGIDLNPFEVIFVKVKGHFLWADWTTSTAAVVYDRWNSEKV